jgi:hypothetical protein
LIVEGECINMIGFNFTHGWAVILGSFAKIALVLTALGIMLYMVKQADAVKHFGAVLGIVAVVMLAPGIMLNAWLVIPSWQRIALLAIGICIWQWRRPRRKSPKRDRH